MAIKRIGKGLLAAALLALLPMPVAAQLMSDTYDFLKAVKDRNSEDLTKLLAKPSFQGIDTHDLATGETALHIVVKRRDMDYLRFLLSKGAQANLRDHDGATPLFDAATIGWDEGLQQLLEIGASPNIANNSGETPLMRAAAGHDTDAVRLLIAAGANPAAKDRMTGKTARDYAAQGGRGEAILKIIDAAGPPKPMIGPHF